MPQKKLIMKFLNRRVAVGSTAVVGIAVMVTGFIVAVVVPAITFVGILAIGVGAVVVAGALGVIASGGKV